MVRLLTVRYSVHSEQLTRTAIFALFDNHNLIAADVLKRYLKELVGVIAIIVMELLKRPNIKRDDFVVGIVRRFVDKRNVLFVHCLLHIDGPANAMNRLKAFFEAFLAQAVARTLKPAAAIKAQHVVLQLPGGSAMHFECVDAERFGRHGSVGQCLGRARLCDLRVQKSPSVYGDLVR